MIGSRFWVAIGMSLLLTHDGDFVGGIIMLAAAIIVAELRQVMLAERAKQEEGK